MEINRDVSTAYPDSAPRTASSFRADPLRQRYLRIWIRMHLAQEYESRLRGESGLPLNADERRRMACRTLFSVWRQAQDIGLRLPPMRESSLLIAERSSSVTHPAERQNKYRNERAPVSEGDSLL